MGNPEIIGIEKNIIRALELFSEDNNIPEERIFRKNFHIQFFEKLKELWNSDSNLETSIKVNYGLIHNSIHANFDNSTCEIADFLLVVRKDDNFKFANSVLLQVKCSEAYDNNKNQKYLYANWPRFTFKRPRNRLFLNDSTNPENIQINNTQNQSLYLEYSKNDIRCPKKYLIKNCVQDREGFYFKEEIYFSNFLMNFLIQNNNYGRQFSYSPVGFNLTNRNQYNRRIKIKKLLGCLTKGIILTDDWDFIINSILEYSSPKSSSGVERLKETTLQFIPLTNNIKPILTFEEQAEEKSLRIIEIMIDNKYVG